MRIRLGKFLGAGLGWAFAGPIGALIGFVAGSILDADIKVKTTAGKTTRGDFGVSLVILIAAVMKADGKVLRSELDYVKAFLSRNFGGDGAKEMLALLRDVLKKEINIEAVCIQIRSNLNYSSRLQLLHFLYGVAGSDGNFHRSEIELLSSIAYHLGINSKDRDSIKSMFIISVSSEYKILEIEPNASNDEVKQAYKKMAKKYHPDKVSYLGEDMQKAANEKFARVNEAYEKIKKERGMK